LEAQRPRVVLTLGRFIPGLLGTLSPTLERAGWSASCKFAELDRHSVAVVHDVEFSRVEAVICSVVALTHPSHRAANVKHRTFTSPAKNVHQRRLTGGEAEIAMVQEAFKRNRIKLYPGRRWPQAT
jgi:hypothetical protein